MRAALVVTLLLLLLVPPAPASGEGLVVPAPKVGDHAVFAYSSVGADGSLGLYAHQFVNWTGPPADVEDAFGAVHRAYRVDRHVSYTWFSYRYDADTLLDLATRASVAQPGYYGGSQWEGSSDWLVATTTDSFHDVAPGLTFSSYLLMEHALSGRTLQPGDVIVLVDPSGPRLGEVPLNVSFTAIGWEDVAGEPLFRVEVETRRPDGTLYSSNSSLYFDGERPVPTLRLHRVLYSDGTTRVTQVQLIEHESGSGPALADPAYVPPEPRSERPDALRAVWGRDGPGDAFPGTFPLSDAVAAVRSDPQTAAWFQVHPDAWVGAGNYEENSYQALARWSLAFVSANETLVARVRQAHSPTLSGGPSIVEYYYTEAWSRAATSPVEGRSLACAGEARRQALAAEHEPTDDGLGGVVWSASFGTTSKDVSCYVKVQRTLNHYSVEGDVGYKESWPVAYSRVYGTTGGTYMAGAGISHVGTWAELDSPEQGVADVVGFVEWFSEAMIEYLVEQTG